MPQSNRKIASPRLYTVPQLIELRRQMLRFARSLPPGSARKTVAKQRLPFTGL
jgi:hypothetical protein